MPGLRGQHPPVFQGPSPQAACGAGAARVCKAQRACGGEEQERELF